MEDTLAKINRAGMRLLETLTPEDTYGIIVKEAMTLVDAEHGSIFLHRNETLERVYTSLPNLNGNIIRKKGYVYKAFKTKKPYVMNATELKKVHPQLLAYHINSTVFIPLSYHQESIGVLTLNSYKDEHFTKKEFDVLELFGSMASLAIKKSQMYSETKKALEIRDMFISMAAHELRTPLTSINGYIQLLHSKMSKREGIESKWMSELYEESKRLTTLVKELLEVNRLKTGQIQFMWQECNLNAILLEALQEIKDAHPDRTIHVENKLASGSDVLIGDPSKLSKVFINIIDNALKYSPKQTDVSVIVSEKSGFFLISVKDKGRGIDERDLPNIFEGHHRGESGEEGMGIGLFFVENVIRQHRGAISVKSKLKKGTTFEIRLPKSKI